MQNPQKGFDTPYKVGLGKRAANKQVEAGGHSLALASQPLNQFTVGKLSHQFSTSNPMESTLPLFAFVYQAQHPFP